MENKWIPTAKVLPKPGKWVLARGKWKNWIDPDDQANVNCVVVKLVKGLSRKERKKTGYRTYVAADQWDNNLLPYNWESFGPSSYFGHTITHWTPIPKFTE